MATRQRQQYRSAPRTQYAYPAPVSSPGTNGLAIMALVSVFIFGPLAVLLGHIARHQIRRTGESGAGIALGALFIGYVETIAMIALILAIAGSAGSYA